MSKSNNSFNFKKKLNKLLRNESLSDDELFIATNYLIKDYDSFITNQRKNEFRELYE